MHKCLLADPLLRHLVLERIAHLKIVAEHIVESHLQGWYSRALALALLYLQQIVLAVAGDGAQVVEFFVVAVGDDVAFADELGRVGLDLFLYAVFQALAEVELFTDPLERFVVGIEASVLHGADGVEGVAQLHDLAWGHAPHSHLRDDSFQVSHAVELFVDEVAEVGLLEEILHHVESLIDLAGVFQRKYHPPPQHSASHGRHGQVYDIKQTLAVFLHGLQQFQ